MKKIFAIIIFIIFYNSVFAVDFEKIGDELFAKKNRTRDLKAAVINIDRAIYYYEKAIASREAGILYYKLAQAVEFKYSYLVKGEDKHQEKWDAYKVLTERIEKYCNKTGKCNDSPHVLYAFILSWGRYGELMNAWEAGTSGLADKVKGYAERIMEIKPAFKNYAAYATLGRLHYKAPNIIFVLTWPDKNKSRKYLEQYYMRNRQSLTAAYYLADTLWDVDEKDMAKKLYYKVINTPERNAHYFEDKNAKEECKIRMEEISLLKSHGE